MEKYYYTEQVSKKFASIDQLPDWLINLPEFREQIKLIRSTLGMTQEQLGHLVNRSVRSIQQIENGEANPKITTLYKIAEALNSKLVISLVPQKIITEYLNEKSLKKAQQIINLSEANATLEIQTPSIEEKMSQIEKLQKEIINKRREILWEIKKSRKL